MSARCMTLDQVNATNRHIEATRVARQAVHAAIASPLTDPITAPAQHTAADIDRLYAHMERAAKRSQDANKRVKIHLVYIALTVIIGTIVVFIPGSLVFSGVLTGLPTAAQEITDWVKGW